MVVYHPEDFLNLQAAVVADGGEVLPEECRGHEFTIKLPTNTGKMERRRKWTTGCGFAARMAVSYSPSLHVRLTEDSLDPEPITICDVPGDVGQGLAVVCAVDDAVGLWPRYKDAVTNRSYQTMSELPREFRID